MEIIFLYSFQIRVNAVNPTVVMTAMGKVGWSDPKKAGPMLDRIPLKRFAGEWSNHLMHGTHFVCVHVSVKSLLTSF